MNLKQFRSSDDVSLSIHGSFKDPTMVFQHGLCGAADQPASVFPTSSKFSLITMECRGHGGSGFGASENLSITTFADDLISLIETKSEEPVVLGGISMGAAIALRIAVKRPDLILGLVLARPAWLFDEAPVNMKPYAVVGNLIAEHLEGAQSIFEISEEYRILENEGPDNLTSLLSFFHREPLHETAALLTRISNDGPGVTEFEASKITLPTLVIGHDQDYVHPITYARKLADTIPTAQFKQIIAKAENPTGYQTSFQHTLEEFLKKIQSCNPK